MHWIHQVDILHYASFHDLTHIEKELRTNRKYSNNHTTLPSFTICPLPFTLACKSVNKFHKALKNKMAVIAVFFSYFCTVVYAYPVCPFETIVGHWSNLLQNFSECQVVMEKIIYAAANVMWSKYIAVLKVRREVATFNPKPHSCIEFKFLALGCTLQISRNSEMEILSI